MLILFYTTCQGEFIYNNWLKKMEFFKNYDYKHFPNFLNKDYIYHTNEIRECDIFIYQPTEKYTTGENNILLLLKPTCIKICIPYMYIELWPIFEEDGKYVGGEIIQKYKDDGYDLNSILEKYDNGNLFFDLENRFEKSIKYLKSKEEKYCDIKVSDFICINYKKYRLFNTQNHITGIIGAYIAYKICDFLEIQAFDIDIFTQDYLNIGQKWEDSFYMKSELNLKFTKINEGYSYYRDLIIKIYNDPTIIKIKGNYNYNY
jgi:hypothetical protein